MWTEIGGVSRVTEACDWWSLGALLFELLTGMVSEGVVRNFFFFFCSIPAHLRHRVRELSHFARTVPTATVAAPPSRDPFAHPADHPQPPERGSCVSSDGGFPSFNYNTFNCNTHTHSVI